jgi:hypothetical protein
MSKKPRVSEHEKIYKSLTLKKFCDFMDGYESLNCALAHLAYVCKTEKDKGSLQIPLIKHSDCKFSFQIMQNKLTKERILVVEPIDVETPTVN